jgi:hypothetical protein
MSLISSVISRISVRKILKEEKTDGLRLLMLSKRSLNFSRMRE